MKKVKGRGISSGIAVARLMRYEPDRTKKEYVAGSPTDEWERFLFARRAVISFFDEMQKRAIDENKREIALIFEAYSMMSGDLDFEQIVHTNIIDKGSSAVKAVEIATKELAKMLDITDNSYIQDRIVDMYEISKRITNVLTEKDLFNKIDYSQEPFILWAEELSPSEIFQIDRKYLKGIVLDKGSETGHTAILTGSLNVPLIIHIGDGLEKEDTSNLAVMDGDSGELIIDPDKEELSSYRKKLTKLEEEFEEILMFKGKPTVTGSGRKIKLYCNAGTLDDVLSCVFYDGEGIGLYRSEMQYLESVTDYPTEEEMFREYQKALTIMKDKEIVIRTADLGADKTREYLDLPKEVNPALGVRGIRLHLNRKDMLKVQLRAIYRASFYGKVSIMFPMITNLWEVCECKKICDEVKRELRQEEIDFSDNVRLGVMIETPAVALISDKLADEVDFFSCGTNDLIQYTLACDRQNENISRFCDPHHLAVLRLLEMTVKNAHEKGIPVAICGELAGDLRLTKYFLDIGVDELSVTPNKVLKLRREIAGIQ